MQRLLIIIFLGLSACVKHSKDPLLDTNMNVDTNRALQYLEEVESDKQKDPQVLYRLARTYFEKGNYPIALEKIKKAIDLKQGQPDYFYEEGKIFQKLHRPGEAVKSILTAEAMGNKNFDLYKILAEEYLSLGQSKKAEEAIDRMLSVGNSAEGYTLKGDIMTSLGDTATAINDYQRAIKMNPSGIEPYQKLADINMARNDYARAGIYINDLLKIKPGDLDFLERKAYLMAEMNRLDSAKILFKQLAGQRNNYRYFYKLSDIYYRLNQYDSAQLWAGKAFDLNSNLLMAKVIIARSLDKQRNYQEAISVYKQIIETDSTFNLAAIELDNLQRKVAYLWRLEQLRKAADSASISPPQVIERKEIIDN